VPDSQQSAVGHDVKSCGLWRFACPRR
jgi:hypothetical protein